MSKTSFEIVYKPGMTKCVLAEQIANALKMPERLAYAVARDTVSRLRSQDCSDTSFDKALGASLTRVFQGQKSQLSRLCLVGW